MKKGILPIYEPGLEAIVLNNYKEGTLEFTIRLAQSAKECNVFFIAVGTPPGQDGSADLQYVLEVARQIGSVIVDKSTVPGGTAEKVRAQVRKKLEARGTAIEFDVVSNPEFLKEGAAVNDFLKPDRIIVGADSDRAAKLMRRLYAPFSRNRDKMLFMTPWPWIRLKRRFRHTSRKRSVLHKTSIQPWTVQMPVFWLRSGRPSGSRILKRWHL